MSDFVALWTVECQALLPMGFSTYNTWLGCHAVLQGMFPIQGSNLPLLHLLHWQVGFLPLAPPGKTNIIHESERGLVVSDCLWPHGLHSPWNSPGHKTGVGSRSLLRGIFPTQGSNPGLSHYRWILYQLSHKGSPRILENSMDRGAWWGIVHRVTKSQTRLKWLSSSNTIIYTLRLFTVTLL